MTTLDKLESVVRSPAYREYCTLIGAAIVRAAMGDPAAAADLLDLQREQGKLVRDAMDAQ